jgi:hypothetical protein
MAAQFGEGASEIYNEDFVNKALDAAGYKDAKLGANGEITYIDE